MTSPVKHVIYSSAEPSGTPRSQVPEVRPAGQVAGHTAAVAAAAVANSAGGLLAKGLSRDNTGENLLNYFNNGRRRKIVTPPVKETPPSTPRVQHRKQLVQPPVTSLLPEALDDKIDIKPTVGFQGRATPQGVYQPTGVKRFGEPMRHGPNPMELPAEIGSRKRIAHVAESAEVTPREPLENGSGEPREIWPGTDTPATGSSQKSATVRGSFTRPAGVSSVPPPRKSGGRYSLAPRATPRENLDSVRDESRRRDLSLDAAHRRSVGVWTCIDTSLSDSETYDRAHRLLQDHPRQKRRSLQHRSLGVEHGMQLKIDGPADDEDEGNESSRPQRLSHKRHIGAGGLQNNTGDGGGSLALGLTRVPTDECLKVALGVPQKGRQNDGAQDYVTAGPGPWEPLPPSTLHVADGWGRFSPRLHDPPKEIKGSAADDTAVPFATEKNARMAPEPAVRRYVSAPLPYGSETDNHVPSLAPPEGSFPLGLTMPPPATLMVGYYDGGSGGSGGMQPPALEEAASSGAPAETPVQVPPLALREFEQAAAIAEGESSRRTAASGAFAYLRPDGYLSPRQPRMISMAPAGELKAGSLTLSSGTPALGSARPRASSQGAERQALMSSTFVERQRETTPQRGGSSSRRLSGSYTSRGSQFGSPSRGRESLYLTRVRAPAAAVVRQPSNRVRVLGPGSDALPSDAALQQACDRRLQSLREETEQLQSRTMMMEREIRKMQVDKEFEVLKSRNTTPGMTPAMSPSLTPGALSPRAPMTPNVPGTPPYAPPYAPPDSH